MEQERIISGNCRFKVYTREQGPCFGCGFCTVDGNDYSAMRPGQKPMSFGPV